MLNIDEFINRINELMEEHQLNASSLADKIGVQRSSLSHILSKRNKPSLDFILKINENFKKIDLNWLLFGENSIKNVENYNPNVINSNESTTKSVNLENIKIKEIIHLYEDGSFNVYFPKI